MRVPRVRISVRWMMALVAIIAVACAAVPILVLVPVYSLTIAALTTAIPAVFARGPNRRLFVRWSSFLVCLAVLAVAARGSYTMWHDAAMYRRLAQKHANHHALFVTNIPYFDKHPERLRGSVPWEVKRRQWVRYAAYDARLSKKYERAARFPWLGVEPGPHPEPWRPVGYDPLWQ